MTDAAYLAYDGPIATITLNRPERFNAIDETAAITLAALGRELTTRDDTRVVVIRGAGSAFCAGATLTIWPPISTTPSQWSRAS